MAECTEAERKILDEALASGAGVVSIEKLKVAKFKEDYPEAFEALVRVDMEDARLRRRCSELYKKVDELVGGSGGQIVKAAAEEAKRRMDGT